METEGIITALTLACFAVALVTWFAGVRQQREAAALTGKLLGSSTRQTSGSFCIMSLAGLPEPVARYFRYALEEKQSFIRVARYKQHGHLRTDLRSERWFPFEAVQVVTALVPGFIWDARVHIAPLFHLRVRDAYLAGLGSGRVSLLSAFTTANQNGGPEMNSGALYRYLAEAVWYPTALLPEAGVQWTSIDSHRALASLADSGIAVSLEFRFNDQGEITGIYSPGRSRSVDGGFKLTPWEGRFGR